MRFSVCVSQGSTFELRTTLTVERGAKAAADAGSNEIGIVAGRDDICERCDIMWDGGDNERKENKRNGNGCLRRNYAFAGSPWVGKRQEGDGRMRGGEGEVRGGG